MVPDEVEVEAQKCDEFVEGIFEGVVYCFDDGVGLDIFIFVFASFDILVELEEDWAKNEHQYEVVACGNHNLKLFIQRGGCVLSVEEVDNAIPSLLCGPAHVEVHALS